MKTSEKIGALLWIACLQFFLAEQIARLGWTLPYSFANNYVSDLGAIGCSAQVCSPWHALMNVSFVLQGLLILGGAALTWRRWSLAGKVGMVLLLVCGAGVVLVGFVPEDSDGRLHNAGAALHFLGAGLGLTLAGFSLRQWFGWATLSAGLVVLAATLDLGLGGGTLAAKLGVGMVERVAAYTIAAWMSALGVWFYRRR